jgi:hypothetical protein
MKEGERTQEVEQQVEKVCHHTRSTLYALVILHL